VSKKDPDIEPFPYPSGYILAPRNPIVLITICAFVLLFALGLFGYAINVVVAPSENPQPGVIIALAVLAPLAGGAALWIGIIRLRWQRSYIRRHGVKPVYIGQRQKG
jgi:hypothetical protein